MKFAVWAPSALLSNVKHRPLGESMWGPQLGSWWVLELLRFAKQLGSAPEYWMYLLQEQVPKAKCSGVSVWTSFSCFPSLSVTWDRDTVLNEIYARPSCSIIIDIRSTTPNPCLLHLVATNSSMFQPFFRAREMCRHTEPPKRRTFVETAANCNLALVPFWSQCRGRKGKIESKTLTINHPSVVQNVVCNLVAFDPPNCDMLICSPCSFSFTSAAIRCKWWWSFLLACQCGIQAS